MEHTKKISVKMDRVSGDFDLAGGKIVSVQSRKHADVQLCFKESCNIPFATIKLYDSNKFIDAESTFEDAVILGDEIQKRHNAYPKLVELLKTLIHAFPETDMAKFYPSDFVDRSAVAMDIKYQAATLLKDLGERQE